jgi:hypothetical protein
VCSSSERGFVPEIDFSDAHRRIRTSELLVGANGSFTNSKVSVSGVKTDGSRVSSVYLGQGPSAGNISDKSTAVSLKLLF